MPSLLIISAEGFFAFDQTYRKTESLDDGVGAEHLHFAQLQAQAIERRLHVDILVGSFEIDEEHVIAQPLFGGTRLDLREVDVGICELRKDHQKRTLLILL